MTPTKLSPELEELNKKLKELAELGSILMETELEYSTVQGELNDFQRHYTEMVIRRMYKLDKIEEQIAEYLLSTDPSSLEYRENLRKAKDRISEAEKTFENERKRTRKEDFHPSDSLKKLYRDAARKVHPDLTTDEKERERRSRLMTEINDAYQNGDEQRIQKILDDWQNDPENVKGDDIGSQLIKVIRKITQVQTRIEVIQKEIELLKGTDLYQLKEKVENARLDGSDLLGQMADYLDTQIHERSEYLKYLKESGR